ncbi:hypothetical protein ASG68_05400 [Rhizobium sp. Leaf453]|nr:hypothetical protein ASG42_12670 [Rhizobium sp. Leaf391]KQS94830.1 hypothetical protein ASG50_26620 [Rhizobium sp. Leaf386]KQU01206.1 hypothetical protein ASG68_05400 [Rhizobium sp. Leaf453]
MHIAEWDAAREPRVPFANSDQEDSAMAKGQVKSNKETRKPKKDKVAAKAATPFAATTQKEVPKLSGAKPKK